MLTRHKDEKLQEPLAMSELSKEPAETSGGGCLRVQDADAFLTAVPKTKVGYASKVRSTRCTLRFFPVFGGCLAKYEEGKAKTALP